MLRDFSSLDDPIDLNIYKIRKICEGSMWTTLLAQNDPAGEEFVIRILKNDFVLSDHTDEYIKKFYTANSLKIPGVVKCFGYQLPVTNRQKKNRNKKKNKLYYISKYEKIKKIRIDDTPIFFTEFVPQKDLLTYTINYFSNKGENDQIMNPTVRSKIIFGIAAIMKQVHRKNIIHGNLRLSNIFLDENLEPKIDGFYYPIGHLMEIESEIMTKFHDIICRAPEFIEETYSFPADVYSYGVILYYMFVGNSILGSKKSNRYQSIFKIYRRAKKRDLFKNKNLIPDVYRDLVLQCIQIDVEKRPTFEEITEILKDDKFALEENGMKTDLDQLHEYQIRIDF